MYSANIQNEYRCRFQGSGKLFPLVNDISNGETWYRIYQQSIVCFYLRVCVCCLCPCGSTIITFHQKASGSRDCAAWKHKKKLKPEPPTPQTSSRSRLPATPLPKLQRSHSSASPSRHTNTQTHTYPGSISPRYSIHCRLTLITKQD